MLMNTKRNIFLIFSSIILCFLIASCGQDDGIVLPQANSKKFKETQAQLQELLDRGDEFTSETRFGIMKNLAGNIQAVHDYPSLIVLLTEWVEEHPDDEYNSYWLLQTAFAYQQCNSEPMAQYYFEKILRNYPDLTVKGKSVHELCLKNLLQISTKPANRISYYNQLVTRYPSSISPTELYIRMAQEYEKESEWAQSIRCYQLFLEQEDASTIQIPGLPNAYSAAKRLIDFNKSSKNWTFETLDGLLRAIRSALGSGDSGRLENLRSKVNFFAMSWRTDENSEAAQNEIYIPAYMYERTINYSGSLDDMSNSQEAFLKTWGWSTNPNIWYLYFRKVNFPADQNIHGRWEWAGIYFGEKL